MGFWVFILLMNILIPALMIIFGKMFIKAAPKEINNIYGYRTAMSMKNRDTWEFAHKYFGKLWFYGGLILLILGIIPMLFIIGKSVDTIGAVGGIVATADAIIMVILILPVEIVLRKKFDKDGNRKR